MAEVINASNISKLIQVYQSMNYSRKETNYIYIEVNVQYRDEQTKIKNVTFTVLHKIQISLMMINKNIRQDIFLCC